MQSAARIATAAVCIAVFTANHTARAQSRESERAREAFASARFDVARAAFERVLTDPDATRENLADAYRHVSAMRLAAGDRPGATNAAEAALAIDPTAAPPHGASPDLEALFASVRGGRQDAAIRVEMTFALPPVAQRPSTLRVEASGIPATFDARLSVRCHSRGAPVATIDTAASAGGIDVAVSAVRAGAAVECVASLSTPAGVLLDRAMLHEIATGHATRSRIVEGPGGPNAWLVAGVGSSAAGIAAVVIVMIALSGGTSSASLGTPTLQGP